MVCRCSNGLFEVEKRASLRGPLVRLSIVILIAFYIGVLFGKSEALRVFAQAGCQLGF